MNDPSTASVLPLKVGLALARCSNPLEKSETTSRPEARRKHRPYISTVGRPLMDGERRIALIPNQECLLDLMRLWSLILRLASVFALPLLLLSSQLPAQNAGDFEQFQSWLYTSPHSPAAPTPVDADWAAWAKRTGERPPHFGSDTANRTIDDDFDAYLIAENPAAMREEWLRLAEQWMLGTAPPAPEEWEVISLRSERRGDVRVEDLRLRFGPDLAGKLDLRLFLPPGEGPHPVLLSQWNHESWAEMAIRRGYAACLYAAADAKDDTANFGDLWYPQYDFAKLYQRAWAGSRAIDYLATRPDLDSARIALGGHSRNGQQSLLLAATDERVGATVLSSGGTSLFRHAAHRYGIQPLDKLTAWFPHWYHPRLRFFTGRENHLPVDRQHLMAMIAPRGLMLSVAEHEMSNPWAVDRLYQLLLPLYEQTGEADHLALYYRGGRHRYASRDLELYFDFFDSVFGREGPELPDSFPFRFRYEEWLEAGGQPYHPGKGDADPGQGDADPESPCAQFRNALGEAPPVAEDRELFRFEELGADRARDDYKSWILNRPWETDGMGVKQFGGVYDHLAPHNYGYLYYPKENLAAARETGDTFPAIVFLHGPEYAQGFGRTSQDLLKGLTEAGYLVLAYDQLGFGSRQSEATHFYERYPRWSRAGAMVADANAAVQRLRSLDVVDPSRIYLCGYDIGGGIALLATALNDDIAGAASLNGFTPWRGADDTGGLPGLREWSHEKGLWPQLGSYVGREETLPFDWDTVLTTIAPRPLLVATGLYSQDADPAAIRELGIRVAEQYRAAENDSAFDLVLIEDFNRLSQSVHGALGEATLIDWFTKLTEKSE